MKVAIYSRGLDIEQENPLLILLEELSRHDIEILLFNTLFEQFNIPQQICNKIQQFSGYEDLDETIDCVISLGGDGTMQSNPHVIRDNETIETIEAPERMPEHLKKFNLG